MTDWGEPDLDTLPPLEPSGPSGPSDADPGMPGLEPGHGPQTRAFRAFVAAMVVVALIVGFAATTIVLDARDSGSDTASTAPPATSAPNATVPNSTTDPNAPTTIPAPIVHDPDESVLGDVILQQSDVALPNIVQLLQQGATTAVGTLDLCNGTFPSERLRTARRQVGLADEQGNEQMSTEAVLYGKAADGAQAFSELRSAASKCPRKPVVSPIGDPTATTRFRARPDTTWPATPGVDRLAYDIVTTPLQGQADHSIVVYLRRGRILMGVYFYQPAAAQVAVDGERTIAGIVGVFEKRIAGLPARVVNG